ncbi:MAG: VIT1/CCC1 transporter family protein [Candidatus Omnitrophica bacterium]|nr:VIT1/CCC1 transporter family protein [Candidatus Omnitrophota bacterium]MDD5042344.1 VIT1/CCC1 transporter family protein [Candidatus Omnitrophota bacterium]
MLEKSLKKRVLKAQKSELTEHIIYKKLAAIVKSKDHAGILERISAEEFAHYEFFKSVTQDEVRPDRFKIFFYVFVSRIFGLNFGLKLMEKGEDLVQDTYDGDLKDISPKFEQIVKDENRHENELISLINEERLKYVSSMVLGLNDALVELSGALVGFTLALQKTRLVAIVGLITGIAASLSMAASEYLSTKQEETDKNPLKASVYTGIAYVGAVVLLVLPYFLFENIFLCLALVIFDMLLLIFIFTFYISVSKGLDFRKRFLEMGCISLGAAIINFSIGLVIRNVFGIDI